MAAEGWEQAVAWAAALGAWAVALQMTEYSVHCGILKCPCRLGQELLMCWQEQHPRSGRPAWCSACSMNINSMRSCVCTYNRNTSGGLDALMHLQTVAWLCYQILEQRKPGQCAACLLSSAWRMYVVERARHRSCRCLRQSA